MKKHFLFFLALALCLQSYSQSVENIRVEPDGENIKIHYRIGGSTDNQFYTVVLNCSMDGGDRFEPKTTFGDVGQNIRGGKSFNTIIWDVFEDVDEIGDVEFFVKVELVRDLSPVAVQPQVQPERQQVQKAEPSDVGIDKSGPEPGSFDRGGFIAYTGSRYSPYGLSFGMVKNWGFYASARFGGYVDAIESDVWITGLVGATKHLFSSGKYRLHGYAGFGTTYESYEGTLTGSTWTDNYFTLDAGILNIIGPINITLGLEQQFGVGPDIVFGVGFVF
jgi:hypothetical protein